MKQKRKLTKLASIALGLTSTLAPTTVEAQGVFHRVHGNFNDPHHQLTVKELAARIDSLDRELFEEGVILVKAPDVWGQNRMTKYRVEYEKAMAAQVDAFTVNLNAAIRRADTAALTNATSIGAAIQPRAVATGRGGSAATSSSTSTPIVIPSTPGSTAQPLLDSIGTLINTLSANNLAFPTSLTPGGAIALEPNIAIDERSDYIAHLQQLRRTNAGDDLTDVPGYSLYLIRMPVTLLAGPEVRKGYGASVTVKANHTLSPDLLPSTFRDVTIMDAVYQINPLLLKLIHGIPLASMTPTSQPRETVSPLPGTRAAGGAGVQPGMSVAVASTVASSESPLIYGDFELNILLTAVKNDLADSYRHDPSILSWLINEMGSAHRFMREQARNGVLADMFEGPRFQELDLLLQNRNYNGLIQWRKSFLAELVIRRNDYVPGGQNDATFVQQHIRATDVLVYALMVQSVLIDRLLKNDMDLVAQQKGGIGAALDGLFFYELFPTIEARQAFNDYVACKWPIHVFAIDPAVNQQNQLDLFSARSELQAALAIGVASGNINFDQASKYARRLETDLETISLNRTAVGFGAGESTFGWRFYPRIQTPPTPSTVRRVAGLIGGTSYNPNYIAKNRAIESGPRECVALVVAPNFVPAIHFTSFGNWFEFAGAHADQKFDTDDVLEFSRKLQTARIALDRVCDGDQYRPGELARLSDRISQLEANLPSQDYRVPLPFEGDLTGSEIFSSSGTRLSPRLLSWFGEPPQVGKPSTIFILGTNFSVHETRAVAGGLPAVDLKLLSRNVMEITINSDSRPVKTNDARHIFDVHIATPNGISNHLFVETDPPAKAEAAGPVFGYALKSGSLTIGYVVTGRVEGDPARPGVARVAKGYADKLVLSWLDPVGLAPQTIDVTFTFPNLTPIEVEGLEPNADGEIVIGGQKFADLINAILNRLQPTAVTFDPVRNPTPLKPLTTASIIVTPKIGTHVERKMPVSGTLTVNFVGLAEPIQPAVQLPIQPAVQPAEPPVQPAAPAEPPVQPAAPAEPPVQPAAPAEPPVQIPALPPTSGK